MKVETPQILWHNGTDNEQNKNAPIFSLSLLESGMVAHNKFGLVLATAGNHEVNLWLLLVPEGKEIYSKLDRNSPFKMVKVELLTTLTRHDATVNAVKFSPNGLHLATAKQQLSIKILSGHDAIYDLDWSADSRRLVVGTLDHCLSIYEDESFALNTTNNTGTVELQKESLWTCVYRNTRDHTHYVQGVAMDPLGTYVASMSCDRTVRLYSRKFNKKKKATSDTKLELGKGKLIKYYIPKVDEAPAAAATSTAGVLDGSEKAKREPLFAEEAALESFFRRLAWTADGAYLVTPAGLWKDQCATLIFRRHCYDAPCKILPGHDKPSRVVAANPILFHLPEGVQQHAGLRYKTIFCVLTEKSVLIYDTYHTKPIAMARGLHYSGLTDAMWTPDGQSLIVCSSDGYLSFVMFEEGELGRVYDKKETTNDVETKETLLVDMNRTPTMTTTGTITLENVALVSPIGERQRPEPTVNILQPHRKSDASNQRVVAGVPAATADKSMWLNNGDGEAPTVNVLEPKKKKKRVELTVVSPGHQ
ncbi:hypothetical protein MHU86_9800 [Fragilaria crotonensis]|nr:hypothetical protein MHU86_9800 [Fragilaria crotonensis]